MPASGSAHTRATVASDLRKPTRESQSRLCLPLRHSARAPLNSESASDKIRTLLRYARVFLYDVLVSVARDSVGSTGNRNQLDPGGEGDGTNSVAQYFQLFEQVYEPH